MENVSRALLMAGSMLLGVMVISFSIYLFTTLSNDTKQMNDKVFESQVNEFNNQFLKYHGDTNIRAHTIVSIANLARKNNEQFLENPDYTDNTAGVGTGYYISVRVNGIDSMKYRTWHFENQEHPLQINRTFYDFIKDYGTVNVVQTVGMPPEAKEIPIPQYFECTDVTIDVDTKRVTSITFNLLEL